MKNRGFSLLELMIVVAIIMILGAGSMWGFKNRMYKNEILRMKTAIPTIINNATLRVYEKAISPAAINIEEDKIYFTGDSITGNVYDAKTSMFTFTSTPSVITIESSGTFDRDFQIIVYKKDTTEEVLTFTIKTKTNLGVYSLTTSQGSF